MSTTEFLVRKDDLSTTRLRHSEDTRLEAGQVRVRIGPFSLSSNNITYAALGEAMGYWQFFPSGEDGWGIIPVWGFASVVQSLHPGVAVGERLYGYFPMADSALLNPERLSQARISDGTPHRAELPAVYNQYFRASSDPLHSVGSEEIQCLLRPLFITSWLIDDFLADNDFFGARPGAVLLSSASSKTAYGCAFQLARREGIEVIGLTSAANKAFCESLGCYARVLAYEELDRIADQTPCVYVDFAGNGELRRAIHQRFGQLKHSAVIGRTHVDQAAAPGTAKELPGPRATFFFAPAQIKKRTGEWGEAGFSERMVGAWEQFIARVTDGSSPWLEVEHHKGSGGLQQAYSAVLSGRENPRLGHVILLGDSAA